MIKPLAQAEGERALLHERQDVLQRQLDDREQALDAAGVAENEYDQTRRGPASGGDGGNSFGGDV